VSTLWRSEEMKEFLIKLICFFTGADWRKFFPERFDLSEVVIDNEYGGNHGFVKWYCDINRTRKFVNGICIDFYGDSFVVKRIHGLTASSFCLIAFNKKALVKAFRR
jgi:hypothetical protein